MRDLIHYTPRTLWDPFRSLGDIHDEFDRLFDNVLPTWGNTETRGFAPVVDIIEEDDKYVIKAELPGVDQKDVKVTLTDNVLTIRGERKNEYEDKKEGLHRIERSYGSFCRTFHLNGDFISNKIKADYTNGILSIDVPKAEKKKPEEIEIKVK